MEIKKDIMASSRNYTYRSSRPIKYIVIHGTGCVAPCKNYCLNLKNNKCAGSAHYFVGDGEIRQAIEDRNQAWHIGNPGNAYKVYMSDPTNYNSIGIEMCELNVDTGEVADKTIELTGELVRYLMKKYNIPATRVIRHHDVLSKPCPTGFLTATKWKSLKEKLVGTTVSTTTSTTTTKADPEVKVLQGVLNSCYKCNLAVDGLYGQKTKGVISKHCLKKGKKNAHVKWLQQRLKDLRYDIEVDSSFGPATEKIVKQFQKDNKLVVDGLAGLATHTKIISKI